MDARITDLVAGLLLGGANAFGATALVMAAIYGLGFVGARFRSIDFSANRTCGTEVSHG
jgi:hypothetical protein